MKNYFSSSCVTNFPFLLKFESNLFILFLLFDTETRRERETAQSVHRHKQQQEERETKKERIKKEEKKKLGGFYSPSCFSSVRVSAHKLSNFSKLFWTHSNIPASASWNLQPAACRERRGRGLIGLQTRGGVVWSAAAGKQRHLPAASGKYSPGEEEEQGHIYGSPIQPVIKN